AEPELTGAEQHVWLERIASDYENLRSTLEYFAVTPDGAVDGLRLASSLVLFWFNRSLYRDGLHWLEHMLEASPKDEAAARGGALWGAGFFWALVGDAERADERLQAALKLARQAGDDTHTARSLGVLGLLAFFRNEIREARRLLEEAVEVARQGDDRWGLADALGTQSSISPLQGEFDRAEEVGWEAGAISRRFGDRQGIRMANFGLALTAARRGRLSTARSLSDEGLAICREIGDRWFVSYFLWILADTATRSGDIVAARAYAEESLTIARELEGPLLIVCALDAIATVARAEGDDAAAERHLAEAVEIGSTTIVPHSYVASALRALGELAAARGALPEADSRFQESLALARSVDDPWAAARAIASQATAAGNRSEDVHAHALAREALAVQAQIGDELGAVETLERLAAIMIHADPEGAARLLGAAAAQREKLRAPLPPWRRSIQKATTEKARSTLGEARFEVNARHGSRLSLQEVAAFATRAP
ncbi:MAG: hypothetical protein QOH23_2230, partial [Gaiellaceae bacterium]|nr:hypothetical protein [Gaiellaceae bacterium]